MKKMTEEENDFGLKNAARGKAVRPNLNVKPTETICRAEFV